MPSSWPPPSDVVNADVIIAYHIHGTVHTGEKPNDCRVCGQQFPSVAHLGWHTRRSHIKETYKEAVNKIFNFDDGLALNRRQVIN